MSKPKLFLLDDSREMQETVASVAERCGWEVVPARCLEGAKTKVKESGFRVDAALIDLMIPLNDQNLITIDKLLEERNTLCEMMVKIRRSKTPQDIQKQQDAKMTLEQLDQRIMPLVIDDGGIQFLKAEEGKKLIQQVGNCLGIFSARRPDVISEGQSLTLCETIKGVLNSKDLEWFEKPVPILDLEAWLDELRNGMTQ